MKDLRRTAVRTQTHAEDLAKFRSPFLEAGVQTLLFVPAVSTGVICEEATKLADGRIPVFLCDPVPLYECTNSDGCACRYEPWEDKAEPLTDQMP